jgi:GABA(A) receptor-associated protein
MSFRNKSLYERKNESRRIMQKYPDRIPIICEKNRNVDTIPSLSKTKYLVPTELTVGQLMYVIRKQIGLKSSVSIFMFIHGNILTNTALISECYDKYGDPDGFLYITYDIENVFGCN